MASDDRYSSDWRRSAWVKQGSTDHLLGLDPVRESKSPIAVGMPRVTLNE